MQLELSHLGESVQISVNGANEYDSIKRMEWDVLEKVLHLVVSTGPTLVISTKSIGDAATQWLLDHHSVRALGRISSSVIDQISIATGAVLARSAASCVDANLGTACR